MRGKPAVGNLLDQVEKSLLRSCPGYGRYVNRCGVSTPRPLCFFCQRTKDLEGKAK